MRFARMHVLTFFSLLLAFPVFAQQTAKTVQRDPQALAVLAQALATMAPSLGSLHDALLQGTYSSLDGSTGSFIIKCKGLNQLRHDLELNGHHKTVVFRDGIGRAYRDGVWRSLPYWATKYRRADYLIAFSPLGEYTLPTRNVQYVGTEHIGDHSVHHIRLSAVPTDSTPQRVEELMSEFHLFIDAQSFLLVKTISFDFSPEIVENRATVETYYDDWRSVGPTLIPFHTARFIYGQKFSETRVTSAQTNVGLQDSEFN